MLTEEQIKNIKPGDPVIITATFDHVDDEGDIWTKRNFYDSCYWVDPSCVSLPTEYKTVINARDVFRNMSESEKASISNFLASYFRETKKQEEMRNALKKMGIDLTNIRPKYDPTRLFEKGDKVKPAERHGRKTPKLNYKAEYTVTSSEDDYGAVGVEYFNGDMPVSVSIPFYWLELVTPVEELEPYYIETETFDYEIRNANDDPDIGTSLALHIKIQDPDEGQILRVKSYYESYVYSREHAIADAEAECKRLNAEWRKEQNRV